MRTKGEKRSVRWMGDFKRWTEKEMGRGNFDTPEQKYAYGVSRWVEASNYRATSSTKNSPCLTRAGMWHP